MDDPVYCCKYDYTVKKLASYKMKMPKK